MGTKRVYNKSDTSVCGIRECAANHVSIKIPFLKGKKKKAVSEGHIFHLLWLTSRQSSRVELKFWATQSIKCPTRDGGHKQVRLQAEAK